MAAYYDANVEVRHYPGLTVIIWSSTTATTIASTGTASNYAPGRPAPPAPAEDERRLADLLERRVLFRAWREMKCRRTPRRPPGQGNSGRREGPTSGLVRPQRRWRVHALGKRPHASASG